MKQIYFRPTPKQMEALEILTDKQTTELLFGGAAGGAKSYCICVWLIMMCLKYPKSRWLLGRAKLKTLKQTTLLTFFDVCHSWGLKRDVDFRYVADEKIVWKNGSEIYLKDLFLYPSDPEFDALGSSEFTGAAIDELSEITLKAKNIVMSRIRYKLDEFGLIPKLFMASNPAKNFLYSDFYKPWKDGTLPIYRKFLPVLVGDNPFISQHYIENLKKLDKNSRERLLYGNWEYDTDPSKMCEYDAIVDMFTNKHILPEGKSYLSADLALQGRDKFVAMSWKGMVATIESVLPKTTGREMEDVLQKILIERNIPRSQCVADSDGIGGYLSSYLTGIKEFHGGDPAHNKMYANLKSECAFKLAELINERKIYVRCDNPEIRERIIEEVEQLRRDNLDNDEVKLRIIKKDAMKENLQRSPDFLDTLLMRMVYEVKPTPAFGFISAERRLIV